MSALPLRSSGPREGAGEAALWALGLAVAVALHAGLGAYLLGRAAPSPGAVTDLPAVMVDMAPPPSAPRVAPDPPRPEIAPSAAPDPVPDAPPVPDTPAPPPEPVIREAVPPEPEPPRPDAKPPAAEEKAAPEPVPELPTLPPPAVVPPKPEVVLPPPPKAAMPAAKPVVAPPAPPRPRVAKPLPPQPRAEPRPARPVRAEIRGPRNEERRAPSAAAGARPGPVVASPGASAASAASWRARLIAYLQGNLRYPAGATTGAAFVTFSMVRSGQVTSARLARSAGSPALDAAALALFRGALPPPPPDVPGSSFSFNIPIRFTQR